MVDGFAGNGGCDRVRVLGDVRCLEELGSEPVACASATMFVIPVRIEKFAGLDVVPLMSGTVKLHQIERNCCAMRALIPLGRL